MEYLWFMFLCTLAEVALGQPTVNWGKDPFCLELADRMDSMQEEHKDIMEFIGQLSAKKNYPKNCVDIQQQGFSVSGIYTVYYSEGNVVVPVRVYCDMETAGGGWLVFQKRTDGEENFYGNWSYYESPFGDVGNEFWLGLYNIHKLSTQGEHKLRVDLEDWENQTRYAEYNTFRVGPSRDKYPLYVDNYHGTAGNSFATGPKGVPFSTYDREHDTHATVNCAGYYAGAGGWWFTACHGGILNGAYLRGNHSSYANGVNWRAWRGYHYSLKSAEMKMKPIDL